MFGLSATSSNIDKRNAHLFCNPHSPTTSASDAEKCVVDYAVARYVTAVYRLASDTPLFVRNSRHLWNARWARKEVETAKLRTADSERQFKVCTAQPGGFSVLAARSLKRAPPAVRTKRQAAAVAC